MKNIMIGTMAAMMLANSVTAEVTPRAGSHDARVREAQYVDGQVYRLNVMLSRVTSVEFGQGEEIVSIVAGDTHSFEFDGVPGGRAFVIKPTARGARTNVTVFTNRRTYYFSAQESDAATHYAVRFNYPGGAGAQPSNAVARRAPNSNYGADALTGITPTHVWDDGSFTYFRFRSNGEIPSIFAVSAGRERSVNSSTTNDGAIRVSGTSPYWVMRLGDIETTIAMMEVAREPRP